MKRLTAWTIALAAATMMATPGALSAQQASPTEPAQTPPASTPAQPPQSTPSATPQADAPNVDEEAVKRHLTAARDTLSQVTQLPAAAQLTGDARTQVAQLITNFNELITTNVEWRASYAKVVANLNSLIGEQRTDESPATPAAGTAGAVGTSGTVSLDPAIRAKLSEFRSHLVEFEKAAGGSGSPSEPTAAAQSPSSSQPSTSSATPSASATTPSNTTASGSTSESPSSVTSSAASASGATGTAGRTSEPQQTAGTSGTTPAEPQHRQQQSASKDDKQGGQSEAMRHIDAIEALLNASAPKAGATGTPGAAATSGGDRASFDRDQIEQIRSHLSELRRLVNQSSGR